MFRLVARAIDSKWEGAQFGYAFSDAFIACNMWFPHGTEVPAYFYSALGMRDNSASTPKCTIFHFELGVGDMEMRAAGHWNLQLRLLASPRITFSRTRFIVLDSYVLEEPYHRLLTEWRHLWERTAVDCYVDIDFEPPYMDGTPIVEGSVSSLSETQPTQPDGSLPRVTEGPSRPDGSLPRVTESPFSLT